MAHPTQTLFTLSKILLLGGATTMAAALHTGDNNKQAFAAFTASTVMLAGGIGAAIKGANQDKTIEYKQ